MYYIMCNSHDSLIPTNQVLIYIYIYVKCILLAYDETHVIFWLELKVSNMFETKHVSLNNTHEYSYKFLFKHYSF